MTRLFFSATVRNRRPIGEQLDRILPRTGSVLEIASGSGEHGAFFAKRYPHLSWQPSDPDPAHLASILAWREHEGVDNLRDPVELDVTAPVWPIRAADAVFCANMIHIAPWEATLGLLDGAARTLPAAAPLVLYGPYKRGGEHTSPSNEEFDASLRARNPLWGVRDLETVTAEAEDRGFRRIEVVQMPANNLTLWFERQG